MRLMLSFGVLLVVLLAVLFSAKQQAEGLKPPTAAASATSPGAAASAVPKAQAVGQQVQDAVNLGAQRASDAQP